MKNNLKKNLVKVGLGLISIIALFVILMATGIIWRSPKYYMVNEVINPKVSIMSMEDYKIYGHHSRPYIYTLKNKKGSVVILGIGHTKDPQDSQIDTLKTIWESFNPSVALVEGRLGFLFSGIQNPVKVYGESGETVKLSKKHNVPYYTWEPEKSSEVKYILKYYTPKQVALFYSLRPYFSNFRYGKPDNPNKKMNEYITSRTDQNVLRGQVKSYHEIDSLWQADFKNLKDWRDTSDEYGWPEGFLSEIANLSNQVRDVHMCSIIKELVNKGNNVFITMGASHAFRIEETLKAELNDN